MTQKHRKLFPTNSTDCEIYPCDPYPGGPPDPEFFFPLPPPPPPRPPPLSSSTTTTTISPYLTVSLSLFAAISVLITAYFVLARRCFRGPRPESGDHEQFFDHNRGPEIDHPIWYINTVGLQSSVINSIAIFKYKKGNTPIEGSTCSVCLSEFIEDETLRLLPKCNHAFHIVCIDTWLRSHTNCPLCRAHILSNSLRAPSTNENTNTINTNFGVRANVGISSENTGERDSSVVSSMREKGRRSVSMGSSMEVNIVINNRNDEHLYNFDNNRIQNNGNLRIGSSSGAESLDTSPNSIKRSFSCSGMLFSSARYNNKSSSSILPP